MSPYTEEERIHKFEAHDCLATPARLLRLAEEEEAVVASSGRASGFRQDWLIV